MVRAAASAAVMAGVGLAAASSPPVAAEASAEDRKRQVIVWKYGIACIPFPCFFGVCCKLVVEEPM